MIEMTLALGISSIVLMGMTTMTASIGQLDSNVRLQAIIDQLYFNNIQVIRSSSRVYDLSGASQSSFAQALLTRTLAEHPTLKDCFAARGSGCDGIKPGLHPFEPESIYGGRVVKVSGVNGMFDLNGACGSLSSVPTPTCRIQSALMYSWNCTSNTCTGLTIFNSVRAVDSSGRSLSSITLREGFVEMSYRALSSKEKIRFDCGGPVKGVNYDGYDDVCATYVDGPSCQMPSMSYSGTTVNTNCQPRQRGDCRAQGGFSQIGAFSSQDICVNGASFSATPIIIPVTPTPTPAPATPSVTPTPTPTPEPATPTASPTPSTGGRWMVQLRMAASGPIPGESWCHQLPDQGPYGRSSCSPIGLTCRGTCLVGRFCPQYKCEER